MRNRVGELRLEPMTSPRRDVSRRDDAADRRKNRLRDKPTCPWSRAASAEAIFSRAACILALRRLARAACSSGRGLRAVGSGAARHCASPRAVAAPLPGEGRLQFRPAAGGHAQGRRPERARAAPGPRQAAAARSRRRSAALRLGTDYLERGQLPHVFLGHGMQPLPDEHAADK